MGRSADLPRVGSTDEPLGDDTGCTILHVDMDAFFASVEIQRDPSLRGKPVIVGGGGGRGVVSSASYEARVYGVRSAMPGAVARRLCPHAVFLRADFGAYSTASRQVMAILRDVTPTVEPLSVDEAFLDVAGARRLLGAPASIAQAIRTRVVAELGITCSVGAAGSKFIAKLASTRCKPDGLLVVPVAQTLTFLHPLPVGALWGVGQHTQALLHRLGLMTVGDVADFPLAALRAAVGAPTANHLHNLAWARDGRRVHLGREEKTIGAERTFGTDLTDGASVRRELLRIAGQVARRLRKAAYTARGVSVKVRFADFRTLTRSATLDNPTQLARELYQAAVALWTGLRLDKPRIRLLGIRAERLVATGPTGVAPRQLTLLNDDTRWDSAEAAVAAVTARFGSAAVQPATLVEN